MAVIAELPRGLGMFGLEGRVALITGGSKGLGVAMANALAGAGADLMLVSRHADEARAVAATIARDWVRRVEGMAADVTQAADIRRMVEGTLATFGRIDILINSAGINTRKPALEMSEPEWSQVIDINLTGPFLCAKAVAPQMIERGEGRIINISSIPTLKWLCVRTRFRMHGPWQWYAVLSAQALTAPCGPR